MSSRHSPDRDLIAAWVGATICALVLSLNVFRFPFLSDDYDFLGRAATLRWADLLPDKSLIFYRPLSREIYFWIIAHLFGSSPAVAHVLNFSLLVAIAALLAKAVGRLAGGRSARFAALLFACSAAIPLCTGWISSDQDLLCAAFILISLHLAIVHRHGASSLAMAAAILSKETAVAIVPTVAGLALFLARGSRREQIRATAFYAGTLVGWLAVHPWTRSVISGTANTSRLDHVYIGFFGAGLVRSMLTGIAMTLNVPWLLHGPRWPGHLIVPAIVTSGILVYLLLGRPRDLEVGPSPAKTGPASSMLIGASVTLSAVALTSLILGRWAPHYTLIPLVGLSMVVGPMLASASRRVAVAALLVYLWLGIGLRGNSLAPGAASEANFGESATALRKVEAGFKALHPTLPASNVYVSVQVRGAGGLYRDLFRSQPLRVWYHQTGIWVLDPNRRRPSDRPEFLFWIGPDLSVYEISLRDLSPHGPTDSFDLLQYEKTLRGYAYGLAGTGDVDRATLILTHMPAVSNEVTAFDRRSAAMLLYAAGRTSDADRLAESTASFPPTLALEAVVALLAEPVRGLDLDAAAMRAFGLDPSDSAVVRTVMRRLDAASYRVSAGRFARRLLLLRPGDAEADSVLARARTERTQQITVPIPYDLPQ